MDINEVLRILRHIYVWTANDNPVKHDIQNIIDQLKLVRDNGHTFPNIEIVE
jgi:hypothetical protein